VLTSRATAGCARRRLGSALNVEEPRTNIFLRPIGSPLTVGMSGLTIASALQSGFDLRWIATSQAPEVGLILLSAPFMLQLLACVFAYLARDGAAGAALGVLSSSWAAIGAVHLVSPPGSRSGAIGLLLLSAGGVLVLTSLAIASSKPLPATVFLLASLRFGMAGIYQLGGAAAWKDAAGIVGLVVLGLAAYCVLAFELEGQRRAPVLPTFRHGRARLAIGAELGTEPAGVAREPGVRETT
jgi:succinate-acetate transporter protein